jgi:hypothetical protein
MLDQQNAEKSNLAQWSIQQEAELDRMTHTSLERNTWEQRVTKGPNERAIFCELLATVDHRAQREREGKEAERQDAARMVEDTEKQIAWEWHLRREEEKQEKERLAALWKTAARDRKIAEEAKKAVVLQEEKDAVMQMNVGLVPVRRLRRSKEECFAVQDMMPPSAPPQRVRPHQLSPGREPGRKTRAWQ